MKRKSFKTKIVTFCLACFILVTPLTINAVDYSVDEDGAVMAGEPVDDRIYTIYTQSGKVFDVWNGLMSDNTIVWTYNYNGDMCQEWRFIGVGTDYAIQDTNSQKYLTVKDGSSSVDEEIVIKSNCDDGDGWVEATDFHSNQLFSVQQIGTSMRYRILSKCSNYTLAIGYNDSGYLRQLATTDTSTQVYLEESAPYHGLQEGYVHIQKYNTTYPSEDQFLGLDVVNNALDFTLYDNSTEFEWRVIYHGGGYYSISLSDYYLCSSGTSSGHNVWTTGVYSESNCLWKIINNGTYYQIAPKTAVSENTVSAVLGIADNTPKLVASSTGEWRIIRSHYYYNYDMTIYAAEDMTHSDAYVSHADIFHYACSSLYLKGQDNQKLIFTVDELDTTVSNIATLLDRSKFFVLRAHGTQNSFLLNARDGNSANIGNAVTFDLSLLDLDKTDVNDLSNLHCAMFISCESAQGAYSNGSQSNFVKAIVAKGAQSAIGFDDGVDCQKASSFANSFFEYYADPDNVGSMNALARQAFLYVWEQTNGLFGEDYKPYFWNGSVEEKFN